MPESAILACENLVMRFGGLLAVNDLSFSVRAGGIHGLIGPNGAGKTTLFNIVSGFYRPTAGRVLYRGENIAGLKTHDIAARGLTRTFQHSSLFQEMSVMDNVVTGCYLSEKPTLLSAFSAAGQRRRRQAFARAEEMLEFFNLSGRRHSLAADLPHGLQRVLGVAIAMASRPSLLLLDEPFTGMNPEETERMMGITRKIREEGVTILLVEHDMRAVMGLCEKITVVNFGGLLAEGAPDDIRAHPEVVKAYLGGDAA